LAFILSQADHRKTAAREWANDLTHTLGQLLGRPIREVEGNDDRMGGVLCRLRDDEAWAAIEKDLWTADRGGVRPRAAWGPAGQHHEL
jgi:hypothetical protein